MLSNTPDLNADETMVALVPMLAELRTYATGLVIKTATDFERASLEVMRFKTALATIEAARKKITVPMNAALDEVNAQAKLAALPFTNGETFIKRALAIYADEQNKIRQEEQRKANEAAAVERRRLQAIADEAQRKANEEAAAKRKAADEAAAAGRADEAAKLAAQAQRIDEKAAAKVETFEARAAQVVAPIAQQAAPKVAGISIAKVWTFEVTDAAKVPREWLDVNEKRIGKYVQAVKGAANIPGVRVFEVSRVSAGMA